MNKPTVPLPTDEAGHTPHFFCVVFALFGAAPAAVLSFRLSALIASARAVAARSDHTSGPRERRERSGWPASEQRETSSHVLSSSVAHAVEEKRRTHGTTYVDKLQFVIITICTECTEKGASYGIE